MEDWRLLGVEPALARVKDREFAYGVWRTLSWLLGVRDDFPNYTSWHHAVGMTPDRPHLHRQRRPAEEPGDAWHVAGQAARERAEALRWWSHVSPAQRGGRPFWTLASTG